MVLHGGPGISFEYLRRLEQLAGDELTVLFYDQLGGGRSDRPDDPALWRVDRFVAELDGVRDAFGLERMVLLGQSWGGCLALQYALDHPDRVQGLVLSNSGASIPLAFTEMSRLRVELGSDRYMRMIDAEARGDLDDPGYLEAVAELYRRHLIRAVPDRERALAAVLDEDVGPAYLHMWGPHEFLCTGALRTFDVTDRLGEIAVPALIVSGMYDESTLAVNRALAEGLPHNNWIVFGHGSHETVNERGAEDYLALIAGLPGGWTSRANRSHRTRGGPHEAALVDRRFLPARGGGPRRRCGGSDSGGSDNDQGGTPATSDEGGHKGGTFTMLWSAPGQSIDTAIAYDQNWQVLRMAGDGLLGWKQVPGSAGTELVPDLAESIPEPTDGGKTYTFTMRKGIKFSTGETVKPSDIRYTIERAYKAAGPGGGFYSSIVGADACGKKPKACDLSKGILADERRTPSPSSSARPIPTCCRSWRCRSRTSCPRARRTRTSAPTRSRRPGRT